MALNCSVIVCHCNVVTVRNVACVVCVCYQCKLDIFCIIMTFAVFVVTLN